ncbi:MAG: hypothetical protein MSH47_03720 [Bacteroidales bacterium]|nr:hypothetical protein [Bacteroidales bacterium]
MKRVNQAASTNLPFFRRAYKKRVFIGLAIVGCRAKALIHWRAFPHARQCLNKFGTALVGTKIFPTPAFCR